MDDRDPLVFATYANTGSARLPGGPRVVRIEVHPDVVEMMLFVVPEVYAVLGEDGEVEIGQRSPLPVRFVLAHYSDGSVKTIDMQHEGG